MKQVITVIIFLFISLTAVSQNNVGIKSDGSLPDSSAKLDIQSTTQGVLLPRMTTAQRNSMPKKAPGLIVFDTDKQTLYIYNGARWNALAAVTNDDLAAFATSAAPGSGEYEYFGCAVSVSGDWAAVGASGYDLPGKTDCGAVYIFHREDGQWKQHQIITANEAAASESFGSSVSIEGDRLIAGARLANTASKTFAGAAYIFQNTNAVWAQMGRLQPGDVDNNDYYGTSVAIYGDYAIVGSPNDDGSTNNEGSAYIYRYNSSITTWVFDKKVVGTLPKADEKFGSSVSMSTNFAVVGVPGYNGNAGLVYIFTKNDSWTSVNYINPFLPAGSQFGASVSLKDFTMAIGAPGETVDNMAGRGRAYVYYKYSFNWENIGALSPAFLQAGDNFGSYVAFSNGFVVAGAPSRTINGNAYQGEAYLFKQNGTYAAGDISWEFRRKINVNSATAYDKWGRVAAGGFNIAVSTEWPQNGKGRVIFLNIEE